CWATITGYVRGNTINGVVNGVLMGVGVFAVGVPLAVPIGVLTFFGAYFPIVGSIVSGTLAALVALVANGPTAALVVVAITIAVHNLEAYLIGPLVLGRAVHLHPLAVLLARAAARRGGHPGPRRPPPREGRDGRSPGGSAAAERPAGVARLGHDPRRRGRR